MLSAEYLQLQHQIFAHEGGREIYKNGIPLLDLTGLQHSVLLFLLRYPWQKHTKTEIIDACWPGEYAVRGVSDDSLYQIIRGLRDKLDDEDKRYIVSWRGVPEGGYYFQPTKHPRPLAQTMLAPMTPPQNAAHSGWLPGRFS